MSYFADGTMISLTHVDELTGITDTLVVTLLAVAVTKA